MPHKRNPIRPSASPGWRGSCAATRWPGMEDQALWHERDISHSSVERVALPGATTLLHYMLVASAGSWTASSFGRNGCARTSSAGWAFSPAAGC